MYSQSLDLDEMTLLASQVSLGIALLQQGLRDEVVYSGGLR